ncbi:pirin family protein [bacterium]|nr:pirin family protein [bacterium]
MQISHRKSADRGGRNFGWLNAKHTFSFGDYYDPNHMGFRSLRVINEDIVQPGMGFDPHPHRNMEIFTYVISGALTHQDNLGSIGRLKPGTVQFMSAGKGVIHSEYNASETEPLHLLQIWIMPEKDGYAPRYEEKAINREERTNKLMTLLSPTGKDASIRIGQDAYIYGAILTSGKTIEYQTALERGLYIQVISGDVELGNVELFSGDGAAIQNTEQIKLESKNGAEFLLFDLK